MTIPPKLVADIEQSSKCTIPFNGQICDLSFQAEVVPRSEVSGTDDTSAANTNIYFRDSRMLTDHAFVRFVDHPNFPNRIREY